MTDVKPMRKLETEDEKKMHQPDAKETSKGKVTPTSLREAQSIFPTISMAATIQTHEFDSQFKKEIIETHGGENLNHCFQCGTCTSDCPIARFSDSYRPRTLIRMIQLGLRNRVLSSETLWLCAACFTCTDRCPQDVEVASVIRILRNAAVAQGFIPRIFKELGSNILKTGIAYRIPELRLKKRVQLGLPPLPKGNPDIIAKIADATSFSKLLKQGEQPT